MRASGRPCASFLNPDWQDARYTQMQITARYAHLATDPVKAAAERVTSNIASILGSGQNQDTGAAVI